MNLAVVSLPIPNDDVDAIQRLLHEAKPFCPGFFAERAQLYSVATYIEEAVLHDRETELYLDRNLLVLWRDLLERRPPSESHRVAAGVLSFAQVCQFILEPNLALYEAVHSAGAGALDGDYKAFEEATSLHPGYWTDIALGRRHQLPEVALTSLDVAPLSHEEFSRPLRVWRRLYIILLKLGSLELDDSMSPIERFDALAEWMRSDFLFRRAAVIFAIFYLSPQVARRGLLDGIRSKDRGAALRRIRNAAWDLMVISQWADAVSERPQRVQLLGSMDRWVRRIAEEMLQRDPDEDQLQSLEHLFVEAWGASAGPYLAGSYLRASGHNSCPERALNSGPLPIEELIREGEGSILSWRPQ